MIKISYGCGCSYTVGDPGHSTEHTVSLLEECFNCGKVDEGRQTDLRELERMWEL